jgi:hypothetical protein
MDNNRASSILPKRWIDTFWVSLVGEHSKLRRRVAVRLSGAFGNENVGISNDNAGEKPAHRKAKVS